MNLGDIAPRLALARDQRLMQIAVRLDHDPTGWKLPDPLHDLMPPVTPLCVTRLRVLEERIPLGPDDLADASEWDGLG